MRPAFSVTLHSHWEDGRAKSIIPLSFFFFFCIHASNHFPLSFLCLYSFFSFSLHCSLPFFFHSKNFVLFFFFYVSLSAAVMRLGTAVGEAPDMRCVAGGGDGDRSFAAIHWRRGQTRNSPPTCIVQLQNSCTFLFSF